MPSQTNAQVRSGSTSGSSRSKSGSRGRGSSNRFQVYPYSNLPELQIGESGVEAIKNLIGVMITPPNEAFVAALAICDWLANQRGPAAGHFNRQRITLLRRIGTTDAATNSARQYAGFAPEMDSAAAVATSKLVMDEDRLLRWFNGQRINLSRLAESLEIRYLQFERLSGCGKLQGAAQAMLATVQLRQSQRPDGSVKEVPYSMSLVTMGQALDLLGESYTVRGVDSVIGTLTSMAEQIGSVPSHTAIGQPATSGSTRQATAAGV